MKRADSDRDRVFLEYERSNYLWCLHCERGYERGKWRIVDDLQLCPYADCDGSTVLDGRDWESVRDYHPDYPESPAWGQRYPFDPSEERRRAAIQSQQLLSYQAAVERAHELGAIVASTGAGPLSVAGEPGSTDREGFATLLDEVWCDALGTDPSWWLVVKAEEPYGGDVTGTEFRGILRTDEARAAWEAGWAFVDP